MGTMTYTVVGVKIKENKKKKQSHVRRSPSSTAWSPIRCATLRVILPPAAALQPATASTLAAAALSKLLETNCASCSILAIIGATLARDVAPRHRRLSAAAVARRTVSRGTRRREAHHNVGVATTRVAQGAIRPPANPHPNGRDGNAPVVQLADFSLLFVPPKSRPRLATPRPLSGGRYTPPLNRYSLAFAPAFPPAAETLAGKPPLAVGQDAVRRPSYCSRVRPPGPPCLPGGWKRPPRARCN